MNKYEEYSTQNHLTLKSSNFTQIKNALLSWFLQERDQRTLQWFTYHRKNQSSLPKNIYDDNCSAGGGWLDNFNKTFEFRLVTKLFSNKSSWYLFNKIKNVYKKFTYHHHVVQQ